MSSHPALRSPPPIAQPDEAQAVIGHLNEVMDALLHVVEQETDLVRAGRMREAVQLEPSKSDLARLYTADTLRVKASAPYLEAKHPNLLKALRQRHEVFRSTLQINLTVLATAHGVAEGIIRGVSNEMQRRSLPHGYTSAGHRAAPDPRRGAPLTLSRSL